MISPKAGLPTGTQIRNIANIVFDGNPPIATDQVNDEDPSQGIDPTKQALITIDNTVPTSTVAALPGHRKLDELHRELVGKRWRWLGHRVLQRLCLRRRRAVRQLS